MATNSMVDTAFEILSGRKQPIVFIDLYTKTCDKLKIENPAERKAKMARFYTDLSLDKRFASLKDNKWDLTNRRKFDETFIDVDDLSLEDEDDRIEINEEDNNQKIYTTDDDDAR